MVDALSDSVLVPPLLVLTPEGVITHVTAPVLDLLGHKNPADVVGKRGRSFWLDPGKAEVIRDQCLRDGYWHGDFTVKRTDGNAVAVLAKAWVVRDVQDNAAVVLLLSQSRQALELYSMFGVAGVLAVPEIMVRGVVHDIRNMMGVPVGLLPVLKERSKPATPVEQEMWRDLEIACTHLMEIVKVMESWMGSWTARTGTRKTLDVGVLAESAVRMAMAGAHADMSFNMTRGPLHVRCDESGVFRVFVNLALNARQAMNDGGRFDVGADAVTVDGVKYARVTLRDTGPGMTASQLQQVFDCGYTTKEDGHGIGLAISRHIIEDNGGRLTAESTSGQGTTFAVLLPVKSA